MIKTLAYAAQNETSELKRIEIERRALLDNDIQIDILFCGICHSDLHVARNEWKNTLYPSVPGHEILGKVSKVGAKVAKHKVGDLVGVGCIIGSCQNCPSCSNDLEQYCDKGFTLVFNSKDESHNSLNFGGFSKLIVVNENYAVKIPKEFHEKDLSKVAPLLCAGITTYSPLSHWKVGRSKKVGIIGLGGLGHMAVKIAKAMGAHVTIITSSSHKVDAANHLGVNHVIHSKNLEDMKSNENTLDFILDTVSGLHDLNDYLSLLKRDGQMCIVGLPSEPYKNIKADIFIHKRRSLAGSLIGSIKETQEMLEFCAINDIFADVEIINIKDVNIAFERMLKGDVKYRFVIDISTLN